MDVDSVCPKRMDDLLGPIHHWILRRNVYRCGSHVRFGGDGKPNSRYIGYGDDLDACFRDRVYVSAEFILLNSVVKIC